MVDEPWDLVEKKKKKVSVTIILHYRKLKKYYWNFWRWIFFFSFQPTRTLKIDFILDNHPTTRSPCYPSLLKAELSVSAQTVLLLIFNIVIITYAATVIFDFVLTVPDCGELIQALEDCHKQGFMKRAFGTCNNQKAELSRCLHAERVSRERENMKKSLEKRKKVTQRWKEMEEEEFGPGGYLREVAQKKE